MPLTYSCGRYRTWFYFLALVKLSVVEVVKNPLLGLIAIFIIKYQSANPYFAADSDHRQTYFMGF